ncbi:hypothetical protein MFIFM68171_10593 [Madurella fahalii]|uniref:Uncharacterized protein n=1 Tax=Madurella fahalii TaxID=1157608 RepID=A0ABQ0GRL8_9PEZI
MEARKVMPSPVLNETKRIVFSVSLHSGRVRVTYLSNWNSPARSRTVAAFSKFILVFVRPQQFHHLSAPTAVDRIDEVVPRPPTKSIAMEIMISKEEGSTNPKVDFLLLLER